MDRGVFMRCMAASFHDRDEDNYKLFPRIVEALVCRRQLEPGRPLGARPFRLPSRRRGGRAGWRLSMVEPRNCSIYEALRRVEKKSVHGAQRSWTLFFSRTRHDPYIKRFQRVPSNRLSGFGYLVAGT
jgi:hypothetical protein